MASECNPESVMEQNFEHRDHTDNLLAALAKQDAYKSKSDLESRDHILQELKEVIHKWVIKVGKEEQVNHSLLKKHGTQLLPYGGHQLGIVAKDGDFDCVCVAPAYISRISFFRRLAPMLDGLADTERIRTVEAAYVPIIQIMYKTINIDLCLATTGLDFIPDDLDVNDLQILNGMDQVSCAALNGVRVGHSLLSLLPDYDTFAVALKFIKLWAKRHGLHNSAMGYPGGVSWSIMVAKVCQLYPTAAPADLVEKFFRTYSEWYWPQPVLLCPLSDHDRFNLKAWNPKRRGSDAYHIMPVITPVYPEKNTNFSVTHSARKVIEQFLKDGSSTVNHVQRGQSTWDELLKPYPFLSHYKHFLLITAIAAASGDLYNWTGLAESRIRHLVTSLEKISSIQLLHLWPQTHTNSVQNTSSWLIGLQFVPNQPLHLDIVSEVSSFAHDLENVAAERNIYQPGMSLAVTHVKRKNMDRYLSPETMAALSKHN